MKKFEFMILKVLMLIWKWWIKLKEKWGKPLKNRLIYRVSQVKPEKLSTKIFCKVHWFHDRLLRNFKNKFQIMTQKWRFLVQLYLQLKLNSNSIVKIENSKNINLQQKKISSYLLNLGGKLLWKVFHKSFKMIFKILRLIEEKISLNLKNFILKIAKVVYKKSYKRAEVKVDNKVEKIFLTENFWIVASSQLVKMQLH